MNDSQLLKQLQKSFASFADNPSARNFVELQKAMISYQEKRSQEKQEQERDRYLKSKVDYDYYDTEDYLCEGFPGKKVEYRCTINGVYDNPDCPGHKKLDAREASYIIARSPHGALAQMREEYPEFSKEGFTVEVWKILE